MPPEFTAFELAVTALLLDRKLVKHDQLAALKMAHDFLSFVESNRSSLGELGFVAAVEKGIAKQEAEFARASRGEQTETFVRLGVNEGTDSEFHNLLKRCGAPKKLLQAGFKAQLNRLNKYGIKVSAPLDAPKENPFQNALIVTKDDLIRYVEKAIQDQKTENRRAKQKERNSYKKSV